MKIEEQSAIVTVALRGLGGATVDMLQKSGAKVVAILIMNEDLGQSKKPKTVNGTFLSRLDSYDASSVGGSALQSQSCTERLAYS